MGERAQLGGLGPEGSARPESARTAAGLELDQLRLLASALAGRRLEVAPAAPGERSWTDGTTVYLDPEVPHAERIRTLSVQASLVAAGSLEPAVLRHLRRRPALGQRYLAIEAHRALHHSGAVLPPVARTLIDHSVARSTQSAEDSLRRARTQRSGAEPPAVFGRIDAKRSLDAMHDDQSSGSPAAKPSAADTLELAGFDAEADDDAPDLSMMTSPVGGGGPVGKLIRKLLRPGRSRTAGGSPGADAVAHLTRGDPGTGGAAGVVHRAASDGELQVAPDERGRRHPEWDVHRRRYRPDWCTVVETDPLPTTTSRSAPPDPVALRRALVRIGLDLTRCRRRRQGDEIDIDAAVEARVDTLAGHPHDDDHYIESVRRRRDLSVLVLLDVSGSAAEPGTAGRSVHEHQRAAAAALTTALHELGDRLALYAFNSRGRGAVQFLRVKTFDDPLDGHALSRLDDLVPAAYTRLGAAIRHGSSILEERSGTPRRLLVVLSDGFAYDHGYEGRYGEADSRRALLEARRRGIGCLCLSVGADGDPAALRRVFGSAAHASVPRAGELAGLIGPLFRSALRTAEGQRRSFQRVERTRERLEVERTRT